MPFTKKLYVINKQLLQLIIIVCSMNNIGYAQCSNQLPEKKFWGDDRPATECEVIFYRATYPKILKAFNGVEAYFASDWEAKYNLPDKANGIKDLEANQVNNPVYIHNVTVAIGSEKKFFGDIQNLSWSYKKKESNEDVINYYNAIKPTLDSADETIKTKALKIGFDAVGKEPVVCRAAMLGNAYNSKFNFTLTINGINYIEDKLDDVKAVVELLPLKNTTYAIRIIKDKSISNTQASEEANPNNHLDELHLYIGKWKAPQISKGIGFSIQNNFNLSQSKLSVQNILVVIKCAVALQDEVLQQIDFEKLNLLITQ